MSRWRQSSSGSSISLKISRRSTMRITAVITNKCFKRIFSQKSLTIWISRSSWGSVWPTSPLSLGWTWPALLWGQTRLWSLPWSLWWRLWCLWRRLWSWGSGEQQLIWLFGSVLLLITALCVCVLYMFVYWDVPSYNMRWRIIYGQTIQKSSKRWRGIIEKERA